MKILKGLYYFSCLLIFSNLLVGQQQNMKLNQYTIADGLSQSTIQVIYQDKLGFIWFGTEDGLNRFDGYNFKVYKNNPKEKNSISSSNIRVIYEDEFNNLWIGTSQGLNLYNRKQDIFIHRSNWPKMNVSSIIIEESNKLWVGTSSSLFVLDVKNDSIVEYGAYKFVKDSGYISSGVINTLFIDSRKNIWIGTDKGLNLYIKETNSFINYYHNSNPSSLINNNVHSITEDKKGRLWIGTDEGLDLFTNADKHSEKGVFKHFQHQSEKTSSISKGSIMSLLTDKNNQLWIGIQNGGLDILDLTNFEKGRAYFSHFYDSPNNLNSLHNTSVPSLFQDKQGSIWIGTSGKGIKMVSALNNKFTHFANHPGNKNTLSNNQVNTFLEDSTFLWIGTEGGLNRYNTKNGKFTHYKHDPSSLSSIGANAIWSLCKAKDGGLWVGAWNGGLNYFDYKTGEFKHFYHSDGENSLSNNNVFSIIRTGKEKIWIGTVGGGISEYNPVDKKFTIYNQENSGIPNNYTEYFKQARNGDIWIALASVLLRYDIKQKAFEPYVYDINDSTSLSGKSILMIFEDSKGHIWVGTNAGLNVLVSENEGFKSYQTDDGLPDNSIQSILEDDHGNLWIGTHNGLSKFKNAIDIPQNPKFKNYTTEDGLQGNEFRKRSCYKGANGLMYFGGINGFNVFHPDSIKDNQYDPDIVFTDFLIFNKPVEIDTIDSPLKQDISLTKEIIISYKQSVFSFKFTALNFISPQQNWYAYMMEGFEEDWNYSRSKREATYTNLDPGTYYFKVKACNNDGLRNEEARSIKITITPPYWQTWWFRLLVLVMLIGVILGFIYYRMASIRNMNKTLKQLVVDRTKEIELQNKTLLEQTEVLNGTNALLVERQHRIEEQTEELISSNDQLSDSNNKLSELNSMKDKILSIIGHDLKNPINAIMGFSEILKTKRGQLDQEKHDEFVDYIFRSSHKTFQLLESLLNWARSQNEHSKFEPMTVKIDPLLRETTLLLREQASKKDIIISLESYDDDGLVYCDSRMIKTVLRNLISNAIKFTRPKGNVTLCYSAKENPGYITIQVEDTGIGISEAQMTKLFSIEKTISSDGTVGEAGTGLGLVLCKEFVEKNQGEIWIESKVGIGTKFSFTIPQTKSN